MVAPLWLRQKVSGNLDGHPLALSATGALSAPDENYTWVGVEGIPLAFSYRWNVRG